MVFTESASFPHTFFDEQCSIGIFDSSERAMVVRDASDYASTYAAGSEVAGVSLETVLSEYQTGDQDAKQRARAAILKGFASSPNFTSTELANRVFRDPNQTDVKGGVNLDHFGGAKVDQLVKG